MKTMYIIKKKTYTDCEGRYSRWETVKGLFDTAKEAEKTARDTITPGFTSTGDWKVVARTIDENTFTVTEKTIKTFIWWEEVGKFEDAKRTIKDFTEKINNIEASKKRCRTEKGIALKQKEIDQYAEWIKRAKKVLAERK